MENVVVTVDEQGVALLEFNRPRALNALNSDLMTDIRAALENLSNNEAVRALIVTGRGRGFCSGADLGADVLQPNGDSSVGQSVADAMLYEFNPTVEALYNFPRPVISAVNGIAVGGGAGMALCADIVLISERASLKIVQLQQLGIAADMGANWLLQRIVGRNRAMALCLMGDQISASGMKEMGLAWDCAKPDELLAMAHDYALKLARLPVNAVLATRRLIDEAPQRTFSESIDDERHVQRDLCDAPVFIESVSRFLNR